MLIDEHLWQASKPGSAHLGLQTCFHLYFVADDNVYRSIRLCTVFAMQTQLESKWKQYCCTGARLCNPWVQADDVWWLSICLHKYSARIWLAIVGLKFHYFMISSLLKI